MYNVGLQLINLILDAFGNYYKLLISKLEIIISISLEGFPNIIHFLGWIFSCILKKAIRMNKRTSNETVQILGRSKYYFQSNTQHTHTHLV